MSADGDIVAFQNSMNDNLADASTVLFNDKNYAFITDSTSNSGSFSSGQIQFDLATLNSQSQWIDFCEHVYEFPVKITATVTTAATGTVSPVTIAAINTAIIKNGWHQWIDSAQLIINGQTIQSSQPYENVSGTFRILSNWSQDTLKKWGSSCGVALDDCTADTVIVNATNVQGLANAAVATVATTQRGFDAVNNQAVLYNRGVSTRSSITNTNIAPAAASLQTTVLGAAAMKTAGRSNVASTTAGSNTAGDVIYSAFYMAQVRGRDLFDINDFPMVKNLKGFVYLSFNSTSTTLTGTATSAVIASIVNTPLTGRCTPYLINNSATGIVMATGSTGAPVITITGSVDATTTGAVGVSGPLLTNARLLVPYYLANPKTDSALTQSSKFFTTYEKIVNPIIVAAGATVNYTITTGVPNARRLLLLPMWQNLGGATMPNPEQSCFDTCPATSGPFAGLTNLQVYLANKPLFQYPIQYDYEMYVQEQSQLGLNGNMVDQQTSGLLSQQLWEQNHRFYTVDLSRRMDSEDGSSKSVQVSFNNPSAAYPMKVIAVVYYEKKWIVNTATCQLSSV